MKFLIYFTNEKNRQKQTKLGSFGLFCHVFVPETSPKDTRFSGLLVRYVPAGVSKRGVDDGNQIGGGSLQPAKENH